MGNSIFIILATLLWGLWGFLNKFAQLRICAPQIAIMGALSSVITLPIYSLIIKSTNQTFKWDWLAIIIATLAGVIVALASMFYTFALKNNNIATVSGFTTTYPLITLALSMMFLNEKVSFNQIVGLICMLIGTFFLSR